MSLQALNERMEAASRALWPDRRPVFGDGSRRARVVLIGEAPGEQEERLGRPFVGKAGRNLDAFLQLAGLDRSALYVTNTVKLRPTRLSASGNTVNRPPNAQEKRLFIPFLKEELELIAPEYVVTLGNTPLQALMGPSFTIGQVHGTRIPCEHYTLYPMYHPASLIYDRSLAPVYEADILAFARLL